MYSRFLPLLSSFFADSGVDGLAAPLPIPNVRGDRVIVQEPQKHGQPLFVADLLGHAISPPGCGFSSRNLHTFRILVLTGRRGRFRNTKGRLVYPYRRNTNGPQRRDELRIGLCANKSQLHIPRRDGELGESIPGGYPKNRKSCPLIIRSLKAVIAGMATLIFGVVIRSNPI